MSKKIYTLDKYIMEYGSLLDGNCLVINELRDYDLCVVLELYGTNAEVVNTVLDHLYEVLQQKENIIKEVREYMKKISKEYMCNENESIIARKVLQILDKENK